MNRRMVKSVSVTDPTLSRAMPRAALAKDYCWSLVSCYARLLGFGLQSVMIVA